MDGEDGKTGAPRLPRAPAKTGAAFFEETKERLMNNDIFEGKWKQIRGEAKAWWGKLTDDDLDRAAGKFDVLAGVIQEKYGYTRQQAAAEIDRHVTEYEARLKK
jgi:uncharacterized protein YjbJ (UPF0337 family)